MASAAVSTPVEYNPPMCTRHCGEIHCSETLDEFLINCTTCMQEFNLLSCNLFIKHVKECITTTNIVNENGNHQNTKYAIENIFTAAVRDDNVDVQNEEEDHGFDPLMSLKVEIGACEPVYEQNSEDVERLSDYKDEDDLTIDKLASRNLIEGIINEYKKHPELWDSNFKYCSTQAVKHLHYKQIRQAINSKFKTNLNHLQLRNQILNLKSGYRRALQRNNQSKRNPKLWYFDKIAFIDDDTRDQGCNPKTEIHDNEQSFDESTNEHSQQELTTENQKFHDRKLILDIINQYKKYRFLWDVSADSHNNKSKRNEAFCNIANFIQRKYKMNVTSNDISTKIMHLRSGYRSALRRPFKPITLWYYDELSFVFDKKTQQSEDNSQVLEEAPIEVMALNKFKAEPQSNQSFDETQAYENEDQQSNDGLSNQKLVLSLIEEYEKHPCLWNNELYKASTPSSLNRANRLITIAINTKFNSNFHEKEIRDKIIMLRNSYRRALRNKEAFEKDSSKPKCDFDIDLYYFEKLSFIGAASSDTVLSRKPKQTMDDEKMLIDSDKDPSTEMKAKEQSDVDDEPRLHQPRESLTDKQAPSELKEEPFPNQLHNETEGYETLDEEQKSDYSDDDTDGNDFGLNNRNVVLSLIAEYKQHKCLWDSNVYNTSSPTIRNRAFQAITTAVNAKFNKTFTQSEIVYKIKQLKRNYMRVLRQKEESEQNPLDANEKIDINLYYFDDLSFIGATSRDTVVRTAVDSDDDSITEKTTNAQSYYNGSKPYNGKLTENKELLTCIIEEYKTHRCLWFSKQYNKNTSVRKVIYEKICERVNSKFDTTFTVKALCYEIRRIRTNYFRMLSRKRRNPSYKKRIWYSDMLSFLVRDDAVNKPNPRRGLETISNDDDYLTDSTWNDEGNVQGRYTTKKLKKQDIITIIELYKAAPILWDTNQPRFTMRNERKKAFDNILSSLSQEFYITADELRYQIRYIRESYFRVLRSEIAIREGDISKYPKKVFFHDRMSFLEPFLKKKQSTAPLLQIDTNPEPSEDFTYLTENRQLMISFIELYKEQGCLWDQKHKDVNNPTAESESYDKMINMFQESGIILTKEQVTSAISFLHSTVVSTQKAFEADDINETSKNPVWFYEHLNFLGKIPRIIEKYCTHCNQDFRTLREYEQHKIEIAGDFPYKCNICNKGFLSRSKYQYHQLTHRQPHKCELCDFQAADKNNFQVHMLRHKGIKPYRCEHCEKGFFTSSELGRHLKMHTGEKPIVCDICGSTYTSTSTLQRHMKRHRNQRDHKCELCGNAFFSSKCLRDHMATHSDERKHICEICGAAFKRRKTLLQHKPLHAELKRHACKICGKLFAQKAGVYSHMKSHGLIIGNS